MSSSVLSSWNAFSHCILTTALKTKDYYSRHFRAGVTGALRGWVACPRSRSQPLAKSELKNQVWTLNCNPNFSQHIFLGNGWMSHLNMSKSNPVTSSSSLRKLVPITFPCSCLFGTYSGFKVHTPYCTLSYTMSALDNWALTFVGIYYNVIVHNWVSFTKWHHEGHSLFVETSLISSQIYLRNLLQ